MTNTTNYGLRKPEKQDPVDIADLNYNADAIDAAMHENRTTRADLKLSNLDTAQEALANLGAGVRPSRIINGRFSINQRGEDRYTGAWNYCFDGWVLSSNMTIEKSGNGDIVVSNTSASENGYLIQRIESPLFDVVSTFSVVTKEGVFCATGNMNSVSHDGFSESTSFGSVSVEWDSNWQYASIGLRAGQSITLPASKGVVAKFEEGPNQTLSSRESEDVFQFLPQPGDKPSQILAECQRYQLALWRYFIAPAIHFQPNYIDFSFPIPVEMRTIPVLNQSDFIVYADAKGSQSGFVLSAVGISSNAIRVRATKEGHGLTLTDGVRIEVNVERTILDANL